MESPPRLELVLLLLVIVSSAVAVPLTRNGGCARHCTESSRFHFKPGSTYTYDYDTSTTTVVKGTSKEQSQLQMRAQVDIEVLSKCELSLRLRGVTLKQTDPQSPDYLIPIKGSREFARSVEQHILKFSWQDGRIDDICPSESAPSWVTNIQRGILSALQNSMETLDKDERVMETDVAGRCPVEYHSLGKSWRGILRIRKLKNLNSCTDRHSATTSLQAIPFTENSSIQSRPLVSGSQECEQSIGDNIVQSTSCVENHVFRPFSKGDGGVTTTVHQKLTFAAISKRAFTGNDYRPTRESLLFKHETQEQESIENAAEQMLKELCDASQMDITITVPEKFASLVYRLRTYSYEALGSFYRRTDDICPNNPKGKKFFMDAVPIIATEGSVRFMAEMIKRKEVPDSEADFWFTSLSFVTEPTAEMIAQLTPLVDGRYEQALLGVSSLVHTFCKNTNCGSVPEVRVIVQRLFDNLGENCYNPEVKKILLTLKAIGNIGQPFGRERVLERCYKNPQIKLEVRLAAINAFRRFNCDISRDTFIKSYSNYNEDSEIRIASYLASMTCITPDLLQEVKGILEREQINQVGSFVWTHLNALAKSRHPERQDIKEILSNLYLLNKYNSDARKFSSAREASLYLDSINSGFHLDTHVIFPTHSFLPHSASVNLTVDVFGHSCNLLQVDGRMEGMETVLERFFGPSGYFPQKQVSKLLRERRSIADNKIARMDSQFDAKSKFEDKPYGSLDIKIFGNTLWYNQFEENDNSQPTNFVDIISELAEKQEKEFSRSFMFLDTTYSIPIASGLPLRLAVNGTASVNLKIGGKFNVRSMKNVDILAHAEPSGAVQLAGLLTIEAGSAARTGMRIAATLRTSTVMDTKLEVRNGELMKAEINVPREKIDIVDIQTRLYLVYGMNEREPQNRLEEGFHMNSCTPSDSVKRILGFELCAEVNLPGGKRNTPIYPMNGPSSVSIYLHKTDPTLTKYTFDTTWEKRVGNGGYIRQGSISFNTPESTIDREIKIHYNLNEPDGTFSFEAKTPIKKMDVKAKYVNTEPQKKLDLSMRVDDKEKFSVKSEFQTKSEKGGISYFPSFEMSVPSKKLVTLSGSLHLKYNQKYSGQLQITDITERPITLKGSLDIKDKRYDGEFTVNSFPLDTTIKCHGQTGTTMFTKLTADYRIMEGKQYKFNINGKVRDLSAHSLRKYTGVLNLQASAFPEWDTSESWETMQTTGHLENTFSFTIGDEVKTRVHHINFQEIVKYRGDLHNNNVEVMLKLTYPEKNINYAYKMKHENTDMTLKNSIELQYAINRQIMTTADLSYEPGQSVNGDISLKYPGRETRLTVELRKDQPNEYKVSTTIQWQRGKKMALMAHYRDRSDKSRIKYETEAELILPNTAPITASSSFGVHRNQYAGYIEVNCGLEKYRLNADFEKGQNLDHRLTFMLLLPSETYSIEESLQSGRDKIVGQSEIKLPNRKRISTRFEFKNSKTLKTGYFETSWDADRDPTKKFILNSEVKTNNDGYDVKFTIQAERRNIRGSLSTKTLPGKQLISAQRAEIEWAPRKKVSVVFNVNVMSDKQIASKIEVTTPYIGYESMTLSLTHIIAYREWNSDITATWGQNQRFSISTDGKYSLTQGNVFFDANGRVQNPWSQYEQLSLNVSHYHNPYQFTNNIQLQWSPRGKISTEISRFITETGFKGKVKVMTPFTNAHDMHVEINHNYISGIHKTKCDIQWGNQQKINAELDLKHVLNGRRRICSVNFITSTPFDNFESISSKLVYNYDGHQMNTDGEISLNNNKLTMGVMTVNQNSYYNKNMNGKIYFTSPFKHYTNLQLASSLQTSTDFYKFTADSKLPYDMGLTFNSDGKFVSWNHIEFNAITNGQFNNYINFEKLSVDFVHKYQNSNLRSSFDGTYNNEQVTVLLTGNIQRGYRSANIEGSLSTKTPFSNYEEVVIDFTHNRKDWEWSTKIKARQNHKNYNMIHNANIKDALNFNMDIIMSSTSQIVRTQGLKCTISQSYNQGYLSHRTLAEWGSKKTELNVEYDDKSSGKELKVKFASPFEQLRKFELTADHQIMQYNYKTKVISRWNDGKEISFENTLSNYRFKKLTAETKVKSRALGLQYQFSGTYDVANTVKSMALSYQWNQNQKISLTGTGKYDYESPNVEILLTTPFSAVKKLTLIGTATNSPVIKEMKFTYERNNRKIETACKLILNDNNKQFDFTFKSPFRTAEDFQIFAKHVTNPSGFNCDATVQWNADNKITFVGNYFLGMAQNNEKLSAKATLTTPFESYKLLTAQTDIQYNGEQNIADFLLSRNNDKIETHLECMVIKGKAGNFKVEFKSPFSGFEKITVQTNYKKENGQLSTDFKFDGGYQKTYEAEMKLLPNKFTTTIKTPHYPYRQVELNINFKNDDNHKKLHSNFKWENKNVDALLEYQNDKNRREFEVKLITPFEPLTSFNVKGQLRNMLEWDLEMTTSLDSIPKLTFSGQYKSDMNFYDVYMKGSSVSDTVAISGQMSNNLRKPLQASLDINASFLKTKNVVMKAKIDHTKGWSNAGAVFEFVTQKSPRNTLSINVQANKNDFFSKLDIETDLIQDREMNLEVRSNYQDIRSMNAEVKCKIFKEDHILEVKLSKQRHNIVFETKAKSSLIPEERAGFKINYTERRKQVECRLTVEMPSYTHFIFAKGQMDNMQATGTITVDSNLLTTTPVEIQGKYVNVNSKDFELSLMSESPEGKHSLIANLKNYEDNKLLQVELNCPWMKVKQASLTGSFKRNGYKSMEGSLLMKHQNKEIRVAGHLKAPKWNDVAGFLTFNTPFESLRMLRIDTSLKNRDYREMEANFQIESSHPKLQNLGLTAKISQSTGSGDMSLLLRLPSSSTPTVRFLGNIHYEPDYKSADSRVTLSFSSKKYSFYSKYETPNSGILVEGELEYENQRYAFTTQAKSGRDSKGATILLQLPNMGTYTAGALLTGEPGRRAFSLSYGNPNQTPLNINISTSYVSSSNMNMAILATTPFEGYNEVDVRLRHKREGRNFFFAELSCRIDQRNSNINILHRINHTDYLSSIRIGSPYDILREFEMTYTLMKNNMGSLDILHNGNRYLKGQIVYARAVTNYLLDLPTLPVAISAKTTPTSSGIELTVKSNCPTRTMSFNLVHRKTSHTWSQEAALKWDESSSQHISYNIKMTDVAKQTGSSGKEFFTRINFPLRSLEFKGKLTESSKVKSGGLDFYWDASRDTTKHVAMGIEHQDLTDRYQTSHKLQLTLIHPTLPKDVELINIFIKNPNELICRSELQYSRDQTRNLIAEFKAIDMLPRHKDTHYRAELGLRHPTSKLNMKASAEVTNSRDETTGELKLHYMDRKQRTLIHELKADILKLRKQINVLMRSGSNQMTITAKRVDNDKETQFIVDQRTNGQPELQANVRIDRGLRSVDFNASYANVKGMLMSASYRHDEATLRLQHFDDISTFTDVSAYVGLERSRVLKSKMTWKPGYWRDIRIATGDTLRGIIHESSKFARTFAIEVNEEYKNHIQEVGREFRSKFQPFMNSISRDFQYINKDLITASNTFKAMYGNNEFYSRDIVAGLVAANEALKQCADMASLFMQAMSDIFMNYMEEYLENLYYDLEDLAVCIQDTYRSFVQTCSKLCKNVAIKITKTTNYIAEATSEYMTEINKKISNMMDKAKDRLEFYVKKHAPFIIDTYYYVRIVTDNFRQKINNAVTSFTKKVVNNPLYISLKDYIDRVVTTIRTFETADLVSTLQSRVLFLGEKANTFLNQLSDSQVVDLIRNRIPVDYITDKAKVTLQKGAELYNTLGLDKLMNSIMDFTWEYTKSAILSSGQDILNEFYQFKTGAKYELDTKRGSLSFEYTLPTSKNSIYEVFQIAQYPEYQKLGELKKVLLAKYYEDFCVWDFYYKIKNFFSLRNWMPPSRAYAIVAGNQHYMTFDKLPFDFAGECSYLLTRDFVDGNFTVVANYRKDRSKVVRKSLSVVIDGTTFELVNDYRLTMNGVKVELPLRDGHTIAFRDGVNVRIENERKGFSLVCNFKQDVCTVGISQFYFAKTGGLFGTYDYEPKLDMMTPERSIASDVETFANSWEVGQGHCRSSGNLATIPSTDHKVLRRCQELFTKTSSPLRACFKQVDPQPHMEWCIRDLSAVSPDQYHSTVCSSVYAYVTECGLEGVDVQVPSSCITCETTSGKLMLGGDVITFTKDNPTHAADIVFIVEENKCNEENFKFLMKLAHSIEDNFKQKGFSDIRYRVVGFGGDDIHAKPHIHTMDGQEYGSIRNLESAFSNLQVGENNNYLLESLRFAAALDYRPGTSKNFILIKCSTCKADEGRAEYGEILRTLLDSDIHLHLLTEQKYEMRIANKNSKAKKVIGLDKNFAYTLKDIKDSNIFGDGDLLVQLKIPKDICIPLALEVNGSTFDSQYLTETKRNTYKKFMDVFARRVLKSAMHTTPNSMCCECIATEQGVGKSFCQRCVSFEFAQMLPDESSFDNPSAAYRAAWG